MIKVSIKPKIKIAKDGEHYRGREQYNTQDMGTDLFIRKNLPGATKGRGYTVEIYENGNKVDTIIEPNKDAVLVLLKKYKEFYQTDRAFQNEILYHVTYKTKKTDNTPKQEKKSMSSMDSLLLKQASSIHNLLQGLVNPYEAKIRRAADGELGEVLERPTPTGLEEGTTDAAKISEDGLSSTIVEKVVGYFNNNLTMANDELYNNVKAWLSETGNIVNEYNSHSDDSVGSNNIDIDKVIGLTEAILISGDISSYPEGSNATEEIVKKVKEIFEMEIGPLDAGGDNEPKEPGKEATYSELDMKTDKLLEEIRLDGENYPITDNFYDKIEEDAKAIRDNLEGKKSTEAVTTLENLTDTILLKKSEMFWTYIKEANEAGLIDDLFYKWASIHCTSLEEITALWEEVDMKVKKAFNPEYSQVKRSGTEEMSDDEWKTVLTPIGNAAFNNINSLSQHYANGLEALNNKLTAGELTEESLLQEKEALINTLPGVFGESLVAGAGGPVDQLIESVSNRMGTASIDDVINKIIGYYTGPLKSHLVSNINEIGNFGAITDAIVQKGVDDLTASIKEKYSVPAEVQKPQGKDLSEYAEILKNTTNFSPEEIDAAAVKWGEKYPKGLPDKFYNFVMNRYKNRKI